VTACVPRSAAVLALVAGLLFPRSGSTVRAGAQEWRGATLAAFDEIWQTIDETFYDRSFGGLDWAAVRTELRPKVETASSPDAARDVMRSMLARLGQSHFLLISSSETDADRPVGPAEVPLDVRLVDGAMLVVAVDAGASADRAGIRRGDRLVSIDGHAVPAEEIAGQIAGEPAARLERWRRAAALLFGAPGSVAVLDVETVEGRMVTLRVERIHREGDLVRLGNLPPLRVRTEVKETTTPRGRSVGVIAFNVWMTAVAEPFAAAIDRFRDAGGLVIDLRGNPGGLAEMMRGLAGHVLNEPALLGRMQMRGVELEFRANPRRSTGDGRRVVPYAGPLAILVDELSASASECFAGGLQSLGRARVFGTRSMGQALPASTRQLSNGDVLMYAVGDFVTSTGRRLEGQGVVPDEGVPVTRAALAAGRDEPLEAALRWMDR
jgi:carboxyl-terminal processing protease